MRIFGTINAAIVLLLLALPAFGQARPADKPVWLVVTRECFVQSLKPLCEKRRQDGYEVVVSTEPAEKAVARLASKTPMILLVGDCQAGEEAQPWYVPTRSFTQYRWKASQPKTCSSDAACAGVDGDGVPVAAVGRLPVRSAEQLQAVVDKILSYERQAPSPDDLRLTAWAGSACYQEQLDSVATAMFAGTVQRLSPPWSQPWAIVGDARHSLCGWPTDQASLFTRQLARGGMFSFLIGHGDTDLFYSMSFEGKDVEFTSRVAAKSMAKGSPLSPMLILACWCGDFTCAKKDCLARTLLTAPGGPVAVIAATSESHPLPNFFTGQCMLTALSSEHACLGDLWLSAQRAALKAHNLLVEAVLKDAEGGLEEDIDTGRLRRDQLFIYAMLGDPATHLRIPRKLRATVTRQGGQWQWQAEKPKGATKLLVGLCPAGQSFGPAPAQPGREPALKALAKANAVFEFAPLPSPAAGDAWQGATDKPGRLRLVAISPDAIYAVTLTLDAPTEKAPADKSATDKLPAGRQ
jgi:hypothetical protein